MDQPDREWIQNQYKVFKIKQGNKIRQIEAPKDELKAIQRKLVKYFEQFPFHSCCHSIAGKSIATNAKVHKDARHLLRIDIKSCYQHTSAKNIVDAFYTWHPESKKKMGEFINNLWYCVWWSDKQQDYILPTGAPTSPILCNIALTEVDFHVYVKACDMDYSYSRYIDDLHFSTTKNKRDWSLKENIEEIVTKVGFPVNYKKSRWLNAQTDKTIVTGVNIGENTNSVPREFYRMMRARLNNLAKQEKEIDAETRGCLAYINSIDNKKFEDLLVYYEKRKRQKNV